MFEDLLLRRQMGGLLCSITNDDDGESGAGGGGGGGDDGGKAQFLTAEDFNRALRKERERSTKVFETKLAEMAAQFQSLTESLKKPDDSKAGGGGDDDQADWKKQIERERQAREKLEKKLLEKEQAHEAERRAVSERETKASIADALIEHGVTKSQARVLAGHLFSEGVVKRTDAGIVVNVDDDEFDLKGGLGKFLTSDEGKEWLPPVDARGSGARPGRGAQARKDGKATEEDVADFLLNSLG